MTQSQEFNTNFGYPTFSSIKKVRKQQRNQKGYCPFRKLQMSSQKGQQKVFQKIITQRQEKSLNESSIEFEDQEGIDEEDSQDQVQFLEQSINEKLSQQYSFIKEKLKEKEVQKQNLLKFFREICTFYPSENVGFIKKKDLNAGQTKRSNPLNTKKIKNKIIKNFDQDKFPDEGKVLNEIQRNCIYEQYTFQKDKIPKNSFISNAKFQPSKVIKNAPKSNNQNRYSITVIQKNDDQLRLIKQISDELKKMEFKRIEDIAEGRFNFLKKR